MDPGISRTDIRDDDYYPVVYGSRHCSCGYQR